MEREVIDVDDLDVEITGSNVVRRSRPRHPFHRVPLGKRERVEPTLDNVVNLISDDDDDQDIPPANRPRKRMQTRSPPCGSDLEYAYPGLDIDQGENWTPERIPLATTPETKPLNSVQWHASGPSNHAPRNIWGEWQGFSTHDDPLAAGPYIWNQKWSVASRRKESRRISAQVRSRNRPAEFSYDLEQIASFRQAPGAINRIRQNGDMIAICTSTICGGADRDDEQPDLSNKSGSLIVCQGTTFHASEGHFATRPLVTDEGNGTFRKYYTINDVVFDPTCRTRIISSANDCTVRIWSFEEDESQIQATPSVRRNNDLFSYVRELRNEGSAQLDPVGDGGPLKNALHLETTLDFDGITFDLHYKPDATTLAIGCADGNIYVYTDTEALYTDDCVPFEVAPRKHRHAVGPMTWGSGPTSHLLFASSEPNGKGRLGFHRAFNVDAQTLVHEFDLRDPGDAIALDNEGLRLAVITNGDEHLIRVFDARGSSKDAMQCTHLETSLWPPSFNWDVNSASYSPDGLYLVVARSDNISHVYDSRVLEKGPMHTFEHRGSRRDGPGSGPFGVTDARWVETPTRRKLGLVTGGIDGCVRLWDVTKATDHPENGRIIAQMDSDIAAFSLGDTYNGEKTLVVGDGGNAVSIFEKRGYLAAS